MFEYQKEDNAVSYYFFQALEGVASLVWSKDAYTVMTQLQQAFYQGVPISGLYTLPEEVNTLEKAYAASTETRTNFEARLQESAQLSSATKDEALKALLASLTNPSAIRGVTAMCYRNKRVSDAVFDFSEAAAEDAELFGCIVDDSHGTVQMAGFLWQGVDSVEAFVGESLVDVWQAWEEKEAQGMALTPVTTKLYGIFEDETAETRASLFEKFLRGIYNDAFLEDFKALLA